MDNMDVDIDFEVMAMNELRYIAIKKYMHSIYDYTKRVSINDIKMHYLYVDNATKGELINYILYK